METKVEANVAGGNSIKLSGQGNTIIIIMLIITIVLTTGLAVSFHRDVTILTGDIKRLDAHISSLEQEVSNVNSKLTECHEVINSLILAVNGLKDGA